MDKVLVLFEVNEDFRTELSGIFSGYKIIFNENNSTVSISAAEAADITVILGNPKKDFIKLCPRLKWVQLHSAGANGYVNGELDRSVLLSCATGCYGHAVSEHMTAMTLALMKNLHLYRDSQLTASWQSRGTTRSVQGSTVLVIGFGDIGSNYARRMKALGCYTIGIASAVHDKPDYLDEFLTSDQMEEALGRSDVVALAVPGTKSTAGLLGRKQIAKMKKGAIVINASRGIVIDTEALCDALESGAVGGAGLDVTDPEPLPPGHRLWRLENALITPH
ncbi:MAG: D-2-hydroxyacid dehydrogenase, partial [Treponema sp.]|nr:D-2-hydroxyacid dehydrogenase [Treponema sp.]